jgi:hypothetical protein
MSRQGGDECAGKRYEDYIPHSSPLRYCCTDGNSEDCNAVERKSKRRKRVTGACGKTFDHSSLSDIRVEVIETGCSGTARHRVG